MALGTLSARISRECHQAEEIRCPQSRPALQLVAAVVVTNNERYPPSLFGRKNSPVVMYSVPAAGQSVNSPVVELPRRRTGEMVVPPVEYRHRRPTVW